MATPMDATAAANDAMSVPRERKTVHVEVSLKAVSAVDFADIERQARQFLLNAGVLFSNGPIEFVDDEFLMQHVERLQVVDLDDELVTAVPHWEAELHIHVFKLSHEPPAEETADDDEGVTTCQQLELPAALLDGLWPSLIYDVDVKQSVLDYATTAMLFADAHVNPHIISWNRVVLLHGPPGTGKTSLCKALAQKLSIRLSKRFQSAFLLEINAHSLFSKWFSESGKLVMKLFRQIQELVDDPNALVCVLIDEVESLTAARKAAVNGSEPSDAIRVVNALLTQLDALKAFPNVLILTTSNITEAIDVAFVDRADIKQYIGLPGLQPRYEILRSCVNELSRVGVIQGGGEIATYTSIMARRSSKKRLAEEMSDSDPSPATDDVASSCLLRVAELTEGFSGRHLRKLPFQAHAFYVQFRQVSILEYIGLLGNTAVRERQQSEQLHYG